MILVLKAHLPFKLILQKQLRILTHTSSHKKITLSLTVKLYLILSWLQSLMLNRYSNNVRKGRLNGTIQILVRLRMMSMVVYQFIMKERLLKFMDMLRWVRSNGWGLKSTYQLTITNTHHPNLLKMTLVLMKLSKVLWAIAGLFLHFQF